MLSGKARLPESVARRPVADAGQVDLKRGLVAHWSFEEGDGNNFQDLSGNGNDGILDEADSLRWHWNDEAPSGAVSGRGSITVSKRTGAVRIPRFKPKNGSGQFTITGWAKPEAVELTSGDDRMLFDQRGPDNLRLTLAGEIRIGRQLSPGKPEFFTVRPGPGVTIPFRKWYHLGATYNGREVAVYFNGEQVARKPYSRPVHLTEEWCSIGAPNGSTSPPPHSIDDVRIYNRAISAAEIAVLAGKAKLPELSTPLPIGDRRIDYTGYKRRYVNGRHDGGAKALAWSPDGATIASAGTNKSLNCKIWDVATGEEKTELSDCGFDAAFSPDGMHLATVNKDATTVEIGDTRAWEVQASISVAARVKELAFSPDSRFLAAATNQSVYVWNVATREEQFTYPCLPPIRFSPDGMLLVTNGNGRANLPQVLDLETGEVKAVIAGGARNDWSADGRFIATTTDGETITLWNGKTFQETGALSVSGGDLTAVVLSPDATLLTKHY